MDFFAEKENGKENEETQANDEEENDEDENDEDGCSYQTVRFRESKKCMLRSN
jgi:hypothetical protein